MPKPDKGITRKDNYRPISHEHKCENPQQNTANRIKTGIFIILTLRVYLVREFAIMRKSENAIYSCKFLSLTEKLKKYIILVKITNQSFDPSQNIEVG